MPDTPHPGRDRGPNAFRLSSEEIAEWRDDRRRREEHKSLRNAIVVGLVTGAVLNIPSWLLWIARWILSHVRWHGSG